MSKLNVAYFTDSRFICRQTGEVYAEGQFDNRFWERYLRAFASLTVIARRHDLTRGWSFERLNLSGGPKVSFAFVPSLAGPRNLFKHHAKAVSICASEIARADAVVMRVPSLIGLLAARVAERQAKPWAAEVCACAWDQLWNYGTWQGKVYAPIHTFRMRRMVARAPFALYVTREFLQRRYPTRGRAAAISNVDILRPPPTVLTKRLRRIHSGRQGIVFGLIGSIKHRYKGLGTAIAGLAELKNSLPDFEFRVLGPGDVGPWQAEAERCGLGDRLRFDGVLPSGQPVFDWLDEIDIYVQPSFQEGLPRALIEAMSRGCPAVGSTAGGIPELLPTECLHRPGDAASFGRLILQAAGDPAWQVAQAERNFEMAKEYGREVLEDRRTKFWAEFARYAEPRNS